MFDSIFEYLNDKGHVIFFLCVWTPDEESHFSKSKFLTSLRSSFPNIAFK